MTDSRSLILRLLAVALPGLVVLGYFWVTSSKFDGTWLKTGGAALLPEEIRLSMRHRRFSVKYWDGPGIKHIAVPVDGQEHRLYSFGGRDTYYRAVLNGNEVVLTQRITDLAAPEITYSERWSLTEDGHKLVMSAEGKEEAFKRASWLRALFVGSP